MGKGSRGLRFSSIAAAPPAIRAAMEAQGKGAPREPETKQRASKYNHHPTTVDGIRFDSKKEARYYEHLKIRKAAGEVSYFHMQVPIRLPGNTKYVVDFQVFFADPARPPEYVDVKGRQTETFRLKHRQVEALYPFKVLTP